MNMHTVTRIDLHNRERSASFYARFNFVSQFIPVTFIMIIRSCPEQIYFVLLLTEKFVRQFSFQDL